MKKYIINLINIKIENNIKIECICKYEKNEKISIITENTNDCIVEYQDINFSKESDVIKINLTIDNIKENIIKFKVKKDGKLFNTVILDNKNNQITKDTNNYIIFMKKYKIKISDIQIEIKNKKIFDKTIYELKKQVYSIKEYHKLCFFRMLAKQNKKYYLFNDRIMYADDNAEQLFKYINQSDKKMAKYCYFVLEKNSPKLSEIRKLGKVLIYGTLKHKIKYLNCKMVISSHASYFDRVYNPFKEKEMDLLKDLITKKFIFLQHGVIFNDVHEMLNRPQIIADLFITTTNLEYKEIKSSKYMYDKNMIACTGLARFDKLLDGEKENIILIAPTWRMYLTNAQYKEDNKQIFEKSGFYIEYKKILEDKQLLETLKKYNFKIRFLLHPAFIQFRKEFEKYKNDFIDILTTQDATYSELFKQCSIFVTDYSSTHFDVAYLKKPIIYYQFDLEKFYESHYGKGYFNYERDGFGDVVYEKEQLISQLINYIESGCNIKDEYYDRINKTFKFIDKNNSKRIYKKIKEIDNSKEKNFRFNNVH